MRYWFCGSSDSSPGDGINAGTIASTIDMSEGEVPFSKYAEKIKSILADLKDYITECTEFFSLIVGDFIDHFIYLMATSNEFRAKIMVNVDKMKESLNEFYENTLKPFADFFINGVVALIIESIE